MVDAAEVRPIDGLCNFRDVGGLPLIAGGRTRSGVLYRSDAPASLTAAGLDAFASTAIGVVVDLRTLQERESAPDRLPATRPIRTVDLSILEGALDPGAMTGLTAGAARPTADEIAHAMASLPSLEELYIGMLQHAAAAFVQVAQLIAASTDDLPSAVLVHCTAGKDRTGVAAALMLDAAGVERSAVVADYAASQANLSGPWADGMLHMVSALGVPITPQLRTLVTGTPPDAIEQALGFIDRTHGGSASYLASAGLDPADLARLRSRLGG